MKKLVFGTLACLLSFNSYAQKYEIKVKVSSLHDSVIYLYQHFANDGTYTPIDTTKLDKNGVGTFHKKKTLSQGMYALALTRKYVAEILIGTKQSFAIEVDTAEIVKSARFVNSPENTNYYKFMNYLAGKSIEQRKLTGSLKTMKNKALKDSTITAIKALDAQVHSYFQTTQQENPNTMLAVYVKAMVEPTIPEFPRDAL